MGGRRLAVVLGLALIAGPALAQDPPPRPLQTSDAPVARPPQGGAPTDDTRPASRPDIPVQAPPHSGAMPVPPAPAQAGDMPRDPLPPSGPPAWQALTEGELSYRFCLANLTMLGVSYREVAPLTSPEDADCGIARPIRIASLQPGVNITGGAVMRCDTARRLALWLRAEAQPAAALLPGAPTITEILPGSTYQCRARVGGASAKLSEHALGNAFDVAGLRFSSGEEMLIAPRTDTGGMDEAFQKAIRYGACLYFTTVLGPGSNAAHGDHLHFDSVVRKNGWRLCE